MKYSKHFFAFLYLCLSFACSAEWASRSFEPFPLQMLWQSDGDAFEADFQVKIEPRYLTDEKNEFTYDLKIYGTKKGKKYLAYQEDDIGYIIYSVTDTAQGYSPLIMVSADDDKGEKIIRAFQYKDGKVTLGAMVRSLRFPEVLLYPGESGVTLIFSKFDKNGTEMFHRMLFEDREWLIVDEEFAKTKKIRYRGLVE